MAAKSFDPSEYQNQFSSKMEVTKRIEDAKAAHQAEMELVKKAREAAKAKAKRIHELKDGVDLRRVEKQDRMKRSEYLRQTQVILPNEEITKIRTPRAKK